MLGIRARAFERFERLERFERTRSSKMSDELAATPGRFRKLTGAPAAILRALLISLTVLGSLWALEIHHHFEVTFFKQQYLALFLALALGSVFLAVKTYPKQVGDHVPWYDWLLALGGMADRTLRHDFVSDHRVSAWHTLAGSLDLRRPGDHSVPRSDAPRRRRHARMARARRDSLHAIRRVHARDILLKEPVVGAHRELSLSGFQRHVRLAPRRRRRRRRRVYFIWPSALRRRRR